MSNSKSGLKRVQNVPRTPGAKSLLHWCNLGLHRCKAGFWMVQETLGRHLHPGSKRPSAPSSDHLQEAHYFRPLSQALWFAIIACQLSANGNHADAKQTRILNTMGYMQVPPEAWLHRGASRHPTPPCLPQTVGMLGLCCPFPATWPTIQNVEHR